MACRLPSRAPAPQMGTRQSISVLLPVHVGVKAAHLARALNSIEAQTRRADEVVVVEDGPLCDEHHRVIAQFATRLPMLRVRLAKNRGAGVANQSGLLAAHGDWIAKLDADDICLPVRFARQLEAVLSGGFDLVGAAMLEFETNESVLTGLRIPPRGPRAIAKRMMVNNPINHSTAFFRRDVALAVGGYPEMRFMQDYDLFARMYVAGAKMDNLADPLVLFRADAGMFRRRRALRMLRYEIALQRSLRNYGLISFVRSCINLATRSLFRLLPEHLVRVLYRHLFLSPVRTRP